MQLMLSIMCRARLLGQTGQSLVELAVLLPAFLLPLLVSADLGRLVYAQITLNSAVANAALYGSSSATAASDQTGIRNAALVDATSLSGSIPTVASSCFADPYGFQTVAVTTTYAFKPIVPYPLVPNPLTMTRSIQMRVIQ